MASNEVSVTNNKGLETAKRLRGSSLGGKKNNSPKNNSKNEIGAVRTLKVGKKEKKFVVVSLTEFVGQQQRNKQAKESYLPVRISGKKNKTFLVEKK